MMMTSLRITVAAALVCVGSWSAHAQGVGGFLNKAKEKVNQTTSPGRATQTATQTVQGTDGELQAQPRELTVDNQQAYMRAVLANTRPYQAGRDAHSPDYFFNRLRYDYHVPVKFTWDEPAVAFVTDKNLFMWDYLEDLCATLASGMGSDQATYLKGPLSKVKEIHYDTTKAMPNGEEKDTGFVKSFNPATGVLTMAMSVNPAYDRSPSLFGGGASAKAMVDWIIRNAK